MSCVENNDYLKKYMKYHIYELWWFGMKLMASGKVKFKYPSILSWYILKMLIHLQIKCMKTSFTFNDCIQYFLFKHVYHHVFSPVLQRKTLPKWGLLKKEWICSLWCKFFMKMTVAFPERVSSHFNFRMTDSYNVVSIECLPYISTVFVSSILWGAFRTVFSVVFLNMKTFGQRKVKDGNVTIPHFLLTLLHSDLSAMGLTQPSAWHLSIIYWNKKPCIATL